MASVTPNKKPKISKKLAGKTTMIKPGKCQKLVYKVKQKSKERSKINQENDKKSQRNVRN